tara:strand:+ start:48 stop:650 length:603 start_codon:yes stop_codon:yes gene_type:complete
MEKTKNVDYDIEQFWFGFKASMINFYNSKLINRPITIWSNHLNALQSEKKYEEIEHCITKYISLYALDLMRIDSGYNIGILNTNIKRWDKISNKYKMFSSRESYNKGCNLITTLLDIYTLLTNKDKVNRYIFNQVELFIIFEDFTELIKFAKYNDIPSILDKLLKYDANIFKQVKEVFQLEDSIKYPISAQKIFKHLDKV